MLLLRIQLLPTGEFFVLKKDGTLTVEQHTTFFNPPTDFFGSFAYQDKMPLEPNRAIIKNAHYIPTSNKLRTVWVMLWLGELPWKQCKMTFTISTPEILFTCFFDGSVISSRMSTLLMSQLNGAYPGVPSLEGTQVNTNDHGGLAAYMKATAAAAPGVYPMVFAPWKNDGAYKAIDGDGLPTTFIGLWNAGTNTPELKDVSGPDDDPGKRPIGALTGWFYKVVNGANVDTGNGPQLYFTDEFVMFDGLRYYPTKNPYGYRVAGFSTDLCFPPDVIINRWEMDGLGNGYFHVDPATGPYNQTQTPLFYLDFMIRRAFAWFGITEVIGSVLTQDWYKRLTVWSRVSIDKTNIINDCTYYMPNISVQDFFIACREEGIFIDVDPVRNVGIIESLLNMQSTKEVVDLRPYQERGIRETSLTPTFYVLSQPIDADDKSFPDNYVPPTLQVGDNDGTITETDIAMTGVATNMENDAAPFDLLISNLDQDAFYGWPTPIEATWRVPYIKQPVYASPPFTDINTVSFADTNNFKLRLLYYHGMVGNSAGYQYPYISSDNIDAGGGAVAAYTLSMAPGPADFQPQVFYYTFLQNAKPFEASFRLTKYAVAKIAANKRYLVYDDDLRCTISCILDVAATDLKEYAERCPSKITLYPVIHQDNAAQVLASVIAPPPPPPFDNGLVYIRFSEINPTEIVETHPTPANSFFKDLLVEFFADSGATTPKAVTDLPVLIKTVQTTSTDHDVVDTSSYTFTGNGTSQTLLTAAPVAENFTDGSGEHIVWVYTLLGSAYYTIIT